MIDFSKIVQNKDRRSVFFSYECKGQELSGWSAVQFSEKVKSLWGQKKITVLVDSRNPLNALDRVGISEKADTLFL